MDYKEVRLSFPAVLSEDESGIYISDLSDLGFDGFQESGRDILAYIGWEVFNEKHTEISSYLGSLENVSVSMSDMEKQNWNSVWESNFAPIIVDERCSVRAPFHEKQGTDMEIVIMPKMSFGTGHHQTTRLMMEGILDTDVSGKECLDMGCGTAVLAVLAALKGAASVDAVDIDPWSYENGVENCAANGVGDVVNMFCGDASLLGSRKYDFIFANINRNILVNDMSAYASVLKEGGEILFSGFLVEDAPVIVEEGGKYSLETVSSSEKERWCMVRMKKRGDFV